MQIKICGLRDPENIREIAALQPDFMGFIFYPNSPRYVGQLDAGSLTSLPTSIKKTGVFVNENLENILTAISKYNLDAVQLHGADNKKLCRKIRQEAKTMVIKVFPIMDASNFRVTGDYEEVADYFLFDTKTDLYGGSGQKFNWNILQEYTGNKSFLLSGGIGADDVKAIRAIEHPLLAGVDLNSKFELKPGLKNVALLKQFIDEL
ncbi:MAG TPA: phosphoribosylanthranilate isomerase, partial [Paludibacteraceae bacterium]|nr:phosphoribosylanthranilate isomerase [Paludibacteraceae bacterium]